MAKKRKRQIPKRKVPQKVLARSPAKSMRDIMKGLQGIEQKFREITDSIDRPLVGPVSLRTEFPDDEEEEATEEKSKAPRRRRQDDEG